MMPIRDLQKGNDRTKQLLKSENTVFARYKHKVKSAENKDNVYIAEHSMVFILEGYKLIHFPEQSLEVDPTKILLLKRGCYVMSEYFPEGMDFKAFIIFFNDKFLKEFIFKYKIEFETSIHSTIENPYVLLSPEPLLKSFKSQYQSYFEVPTENLDSIMQVKLEELFLLLISGGYKSQVLSFIHSIVHSKPLDIEYVVQNHLFHPLNIEDFARLSGRSLASFKRDFQSMYQCSPRKWINKKRLEFSLVQLNNTSKTIAEIAMQCGFESTSYFIKLFKKEYGQTPLSYRAK